jgi:hypothetical protein
MFELIGRKYLPLSCAADRERDRVVLRLLDQVELTDRQERLQGARAILYLVQVKVNPVQTALSKWGQTLLGPGKRQPNLDSSRKLLGPCKIRPGTK